MARPNKPDMSPQRTKNQDIVVIYQVSDSVTLQDSIHTSTSDWLIANVGTVKHDAAASARKHVKEGK